MEAAVNLVTNLENAHLLAGKGASKLNNDAIFPALQAVAALHSPDVVKALTTRLAKISSESLPDIRKAVNRLALDQRAKATADSLGAPWTADGMVVHDDYRITNDGVVCVSGEKTRTVLLKPSWVSGYVESLSEDRAQRLELAWFEMTKTGHQRVHTLTVPTEDLHDCRKLAALTRHGLPIDPERISAAARYFVCSRNRNEAHFKKNVIYTTATPGWIDVPTDDDSEAESVFAAYSPKVRFAPEGGLARIKDYLKPAGTLDGWVSAVKPAMEKSPLLAFFTAAAMSAALLEPLQRAGFVVDQSADSSRGKTTTMTVAASVFGRPGGNNTRGLVGPLNTTVNALETFLGFFTGMPVFCMDTHLVKSDDLERIAYVVGNGAGKMRLSKESKMKAVTDFRSVLMADGEAALYDSLERNGAKARTISIRQSGADALTGEEVKRLEKAIVNEYGTLAPVYLQAVVDNRENLREWFAEAERALCAGSKNGKGERLETHLAVIAVAARIVDAIPQMSWFRPIVEEGIRIAREMSISDLQATDRTQRSIEYVADWIATNRSRFTVEAAELVPGMCYGREVRGRSSEPLYVAVVPTILKEALVSAGFKHPQTIFRSWTEAGYLEMSGVSSGENPVRRVKLQGRTSYAICLKADVLGLGAAVDDEPVAEPRPVASAVDSTAPIRKTGSVKTVREVKARKDEIAFLEIAIREPNGGQAVLRLPKNNAELNSAWRAIHTGADIRLTADTTIDQNGNLTIVEIMKTGAAQ